MRSRVALRRRQASASLPAPRRVLSTAATTTTAAPATAAARPRLSSRQIALRVAGFVSLSSVLGLAGLSYALVNDTEFLWKTRDSAPRLVNALAPWIGLPVVQESGELDVAALGPRDITEVVGDQVDMGVKLSSGGVIVLTLSAKESMAELEKRALSGRAPGERVVDVFSLDAARAQELRSKTPEEIEAEFGVKIPQVPHVVNEHTLMVALELCAHVARDVEVQRRLFAQRNMPVDRLDRALSQLAAREGELEALLKKEQANRPTRGLFRR
jgi:hypothetical protein